MSDELPPPRLKAPAGTVDTHMHIFESRFPLAPTATVTPPEAPVSEYRKVCERLGIERCVVVQPSGYGTDNTCTLEAIAAFGPSARGIAVIDETVSDEELQRLHARGIRGARFHMLPGGVVPWESLAPVAARVVDLGWHVQVQMNGRDLPAHEDMLSDLPGMLVVDHVGRFMDPVSVDDPAFRVLLDLLEGGCTYVKLSAPYESSKIGPPDFGDVSVLARTLVREAPERILWASNWPHLGKTPEQYGDDAALLDILLDWAPDETTRRRILVDNPVQLYGFLD